MHAVSQEVAILALLVGRPEQIPLLWTRVTSAGTTSRCMIGGGYHVVAGGPSRTNSPPLNNNFDTQPPLPGVWQEVAIAWLLAGRPPEQFSLLLCTTNTSTTTTSCCMTRSGYHSIAGELSQTKSPPALHHNTQTQALLPDVWQEMAIAALLAGCPKHNLLLLCTTIYKCKHQHFLMYDKTFYCSIDGRFSGIFPLLPPHNHKRNYFLWCLTGWHSSAGCCR